MLQWHYQQIEDAHKVYYHISQKLENYRTYDLNWSMLGINCTGLICDFGQRIL